MVENEFWVNVFLKLRLENGETEIYVGGKPFRQCKYLLLKEITGDDVLDYQRQVQKVVEEMQYTSVDEKAESYSTKLEGVEPSVFKIEPEEEFKAHCSSLQAFAENDYNTELLHSNLSFPLLKRLSEIGDPVAKIVFKEEILKRLNNSNQREIITKLGIS